MHRKVKYKDEIITRCEQWIVRNPEMNKGDWTHAFPSKGEIFLEIGSGKGQFLSRLAQARPKDNFVAIEGGDKIFVRLLQKIEVFNIQNVRLVPFFISNPAAIFGPEEISGICLNFCDPWPKKRHEKRRLTHRNMLREYQMIAKENAMLSFKTDNEALFDFSLEEFAAVGLQRVEFSRNLHQSPYAQKNVTTEYEDKFSSRGYPIFYVKVALS